MKTIILLNEPRKRNNTHTLGAVTYRNAGRKWTFEAPKYSYSSCTIPGGRPSADRVASIINAAVLRKGTMDGLGEHNLREFLHKMSPNTSRVINHTSPTQTADRV
jgi:hypothetical protein